jgi:hypothetical protein
LGAPGCLHVCYKLIPIRSHEEVIARGLAATRRPKTAYVAEYFIDSLEGDVDGAGSNVNNATPPRYFVIDAGIAAPSDRSDHCSDLCVKRLGLILS